MTVAVEVVGTVFNRCQVGRVIFSTEWVSRVAPEVEPANDQRVGPFSVSEDI